MKKIFWLLLMIPCGLRAVSYDGMGASEKQKLMEQNYARAISYFNEANYGKAIHHWEEVLKIDPDQTAPPEMIRQARVKLSDEIKPLEAALQADVKAGRYAAALDKARTLAEKDPSSASYRDQAAKLEPVAALRPEESGQARSSALVRRALTVFLTEDEPSKFALNAVRYARDVNPKHPNIRGLVTLVETRYAELAAREKTPPDMSVVEHKLFMALNHIYEGRYDLAIFDCNEVLELEPGNVTALKRKGSAYFKLNQKQKAKEIWQQALKLDPKDTELKKFLAAK